MPPPFPSHMVTTPLPTDTPPPELIDFPIPLGLRLTLSSLATPHFATSYQLGSVGVVDGSLSYLHASVPLTGVAAQSDRIPLPALLRAYRELHDLGASLAPSPAAAKPPPLARPSLLYGRLYLPQALLEGLVVKRLSPALQVQLSAVSDQSLRNGGTLLGLIQLDRGRYGVEGLASSDGGLLGVRALYNFGGDTISTSTPTPSPERIYGRFSAGAELYYGTLNKSGGASLGARFATLPTHRGTPLTATLTINPLMGNINASYAVLARDYCSLATRMEFNVYSYESEWAVGVEWWSRRRPAGFLLGALPEGEEQGAVGVVNDDDAEKAERRRRERSFQARMEWRLDEPEPVVERPVVEREPAVTGQERYLGVFKARLDQNLRIGLLWEGRVKSLIFSIGSGVDLQRLDEPFRNLGLEVQYSS